MENNNLYKENPSLCYLCGKCSTGCPMAEEMDLLPHQIMHLISLGREQEVLDKKTPWLCAGCYTCASRCPNDIDITTVMDHIREMAIQQNIQCPIPDIPTFHQTFIKSFAKRGRVHELRMMTEFNLRIKKPFKNATLAPKMFKEGKLKIKPPKKVKGFGKWMKGVGITGKKTTADNRNK